MKTQLPSKCPWKSYRDPVTPWGFANPRFAFRYTALGARQRQLGDENVT